MSLYRFILVLALSISSSLSILGQANGNLQIHYVDVGQGDMEVLISPQGQVVLFDEGAEKKCDKPLDYLQSLNIQKIDYIITSHYHADHIGCITEILQNSPLQFNAYDRGENYNSALFNKYVSSIGNKRTEAFSGTEIILDEASSNPVIIKLVALNGNGIPTNNENDLSLVSLVNFGNFQAELGGDLSGIKTDNYDDIESSVAPKVGQIEVYKVHHHGSRYSSNETWLSTTKPKIGIISTGNGNNFGHPSEECLERLHNAGVRTYWTEEGQGVSPDSENDIVVNGSIIVEVVPGSDNFTIKTTKGVDTYTDWESDTTNITTYSWSKKSNIYHYSNCKYVGNINPENLETGTMPPAGKSLHVGCPK